MHTPSNKVLPTISLVKIEMMNKILNKQLDKIIKCCDKMQIFFF